MCDPFIIIMIYFFSLIRDIVFYDSTRNLKIV